MKTPILHILFLLILFATFTSNAQVGINTTIPNALLEIKSTNQADPLTTDGLLIPKVDRFSLTNPGVDQQGMMVYLTTTDGSNTPGFYYWDNTALPSPKWVAIGSDEPATPSHHIGELFGGGIIVYLWKEAGIEKGLIASLVDMGGSAAVAWSGNTTVSVLPASYNIIDGRSSTTAIVAQNGTPNRAATLCDSYSVTSGGITYDDWYLPSIWELHQLFNAAFVVNTILGAADGFKFNNYWSSTEVSLDRASFFYFAQGYSFNNPKSSLCRVRAVRRF